MEACGQLHTPTTSLPQSEPLVTIKLEDEWIPDLVWTVGEKKDSQHLLEIECHTSQPIA